MLIYPVCLCFAAFMFAWCSGRVLAQIFGTHELPTLKKRGRSTDHRNGGGQVWSVKTEGG